jgi:DNA polymerase-3 subunit delta
MVVDCSVPKGDRAADKKIQKSVAKEKAQVILKKNKKNMNDKAINALYETTGFDLRTFTSNLGKLISYAGEREDITENDVMVVLDRTKKDPIYEFTNAIMEKNTKNALFYLSSLFSSGIIEHPLQILSAIINQLRRLLIIKDFTQSKYGTSWYKECSFDQFKAKILPAIVEYDNHMMQQIQDCQLISSDLSHSDSGPSSGNRKKQKTSKKDRQIKDLMIASNPNNPYPIYKMICHSENFTKQHLIRVYEMLGDTDARLKSSPPASYKLILEETILNICQPLDK